MSGTCSRLMHFLNAGFIAVLLPVSFNALAVDPSSESEDEILELEPIQVTGTRIKRTEVEGALPVTIIDRETLQLSGKTSLADYVRSLSFNIHGSFREARRHCNRAVKLSEEAAKAAPGDEKQEHYKNWVVALSNRGVLRAIRDQKGAEQDFLKAVELRTYSDTAARNLARFNGAGFTEFAAK